jgi:uncharacterized membrane protein YGL010W
MNTAAESSPHVAQRPIDRWFAHYSADHRNATNQFIHVICVPAILWSVIALLWCIPAPGTWFSAGFWAGAAMLATVLFYYRASRTLGLGMLLMYVVMSLLTRWIHDSFGTSTLIWLAVGVFAVAWIGQFVGHSKRFENKRPSFLTDLTYLLIGPAWVLSKLLRKLGIRY